MDDHLLPQRLDIMKETETQSQWEPAESQLVVMIGNVRCRYDSLLFPQVTQASGPGSTPGRGGGMVFIAGNYGVGSLRRFNEKNFLRINGLDYSIKFVHDVFGLDELDHYEVETVVGVNR